ncbi:MAG: DUF1837 domain-containing protein [Marinobacter sp.]|uniref:HamA C-terminal domain-containing protein n=1 Tax=Marinobacter TaxID=2742 RepID=UPI001BD18D26|nr:DUF1837 domain-containing protein [Marinobacter lipolyticus]MBS8239749.1 DUF1837 domain-containing protein [Marinobacter lipolyticus]
MKTPEPFLKVRVHDAAVSPGLLGLCVGYELGEWRTEQLADHAMEWLPEFALTHKELEGMDSSNIVRLMRHAAANVYATEKFQKRGEFGELFLHAAVRQVFGSLPAISKIYYKTARNDTVKGFDAVHVVPGEEGLELWLGEVKFYKDINQAINDVVQELHDHTQSNYLKDEFLLITGKIDDEWPHSQELKSLLSPNTSLDEVFSKAVIPVLLTYDSKCVGEYEACSSEYCAQFEAEVRHHYEKFAKQTLPNVSIELFLMPLGDKQSLVTCLHQKLEAWKNL